MKKIWLFSLISLLLVSNACSTNEKPKFALQDEHYQQILERQKASMDSKPQPQINLSI